MESTSNPNEAKRKEFLALIRQFKKNQTRRSQGLPALLPPEKRRLTAGGLLSSYLAAMTNKATGGDTSAPSGGPAPPQGTPNNPANPGENNGNPPQNEEESTSESDTSGYYFDLDFQNMDFNCGGEDSETSSSDESICHGHNHHRCCRKPSHVFPIKKNPTLIQPGPQPQFLNPPRLVEPLDPFSPARIVEPIHTQVYDHSPVIERFRPQIPQDIPFEQHIYQQRNDHFVPPSPHLNCCNHDSEIKCGNHKNKNHKTKRDKHHYQKKKKNKRKQKCDSNQICGEFGCDRNAMKRGKYSKRRMYPESSEESSESDSEYTETETESEVDSYMEPISRELHHHKVKRRGGHRDKRRRNKRSNNCSCQYESEIERCHYNQQHNNSHDTPQFQCYSPNRCSPCQPVNYSPFRIQQPQGYPVSPQIIPVQQPQGYPVSSQIIPVQHHPHIISSNRIPETNSAYFSSRSPSPVRVQPLTVPVNHNNNLYPSPGTQMVGYSPQRRVEHPRSFMGIKQSPICEAFSPEVYGGYNQKHNNLHLIGMSASPETIYNPRAHSPLRMQDQVTQYRDHSPGVGYFRNY